MSLFSFMRRYLGVSVERVLRRELGGGVQKPCARPGLECRVLNESEVLEFACDPELELSESAVREAYAAGNLCLGAIERGVLLGYTWLAYGDTRLADGVWVGFGPEFRYSYKTFVRPSHRGQRIVQALHALADSAELRRGCLFALDVVAVNNLPSLAALRRTGSVSVGHAVHARCFGLLFALRSPGLIRAGIELYRPTPGRIAARMRACRPLTAEA